MRRAYFSLCLLGFIFAVCFSILVARAEANPVNPMHQRNEIMESAFVLTRDRMIEELLVNRILESQGNELVG
jgi:hypothetical protein